jgi:hypothetical protein
MPGKGAHDVKHRALSLVLLALIVLGGLSAPASARAGRSSLSASIKIEGSIKTITDLGDGNQMWSVSGMDIVVRPDTQIRPVGYVPTAGQDYATIQARVEASLEVVATYVTIMTDDAAAALNELEFRGIISGGQTNVDRSQLTESAEWAIGGRAVQVDSRATIVNPPLLPGRYAQVKGRLLRSGIVKASWVQVFEPASLSGRFELKGAIQEMSAVRPSQWLIDGARGWVSASTEIIGQPAVGAMAEVQGTRQADGSILFQRIVVTADDSTLRIEGLIEAFEIQATAPLEGYITVNGQQVYLDGMTFIDESSGRAAPGMWAEVVARTEGGRLYYAQRIRVERPD